MRPLLEALEPYLRALRSLPFVTGVRVELPAARVARQVVDATLVLETATGDIPLPCDCKRTHLSRDSAERLVFLAAAVPGLLVLAPSVGPEMGDRFEQAGVNFLDQAGNCHLALQGRYLARVQGRRPAPRPAVEKGLRAAAYRVLGALLTADHLLAQPTRLIAQAAGGVSPETANSLRKRLCELGLAETTRRHVHWAAGGRRAALELFIEGHAHTLWPTLAVGRFRALEAEPRAREQRLRALLDAHAGPGAWRFSGSSAAAHLVQQRGARTVVYLRATTTELPTQLLLRPDAEGPVWLARLPGPFALGGQDAIAAHPVLVYADLLLEGGPAALAAATAVRDRLLRSQDEG